MEIRSRLDGILHPGRNHQSTEARAIYFAGFAGIGSLVATLFYFWTFGTIPLYGSVSIGMTAITQLSFTAFVAYFFVLFLNRRRRPDVPWLYRMRSYVDMAALSFIHGAIAFMLTTLIFNTISEAFKGVQIDAVASSIIVAGTVLVTGYAFYLIAENATTLTISSALAVFLISGTLLSMMTASEPYWWHVHISELGAGSGFSSYAFNVTLIIAGAVLISIADLIAKDFTLLCKVNRKHRRANINIGMLQAIIIVMGVFLAGIGLFPWNRYPVLHNISSNGMLILFVLMIIRLRYLVPTFSRAFFMFSYVLIAILVVSMVLLVHFGYFDLTAFELICFTVLFGWFVVFVRQVAAALHDEQRRVRV